MRRDDYIIEYSGPIPKIPFSRLSRAGPPGTGKTVTLAAMVAALKGGIVLASSNAGKSSCSWSAHAFCIFSKWVLSNIKNNVKAVANVAAKLLSTMALNVHEVVVYGENCDECVEFLSPVHRSRRYRKFRREYDNTEGDSKTQDVLRIEFLKWLHLDPSLSMKDISKYCPNVDADSKRGQHALSSRIASANAVLCTLNTAGSRFLRKAVGLKFDTLFLDEAAQVMDCCYVFV